MIVNMFPTPIRIKIHAFFHLLSVSFFIERKKCNFVKLCIFLEEGKITIFKGRSFEKSIENREKIDAEIDAKSDAQKKHKKLASGSNFDALGRLRGGPGRPKSASRRPKRGPRGLLGASWGPGANLEPFPTLRGPESIVIYNTKRPSP